MPHRGLRWLHRHGRLDSVAVHTLDARLTRARSLPYLSMVIILVSRWDEVRRQ